MCFWIKILYAIISYNFKTLFERGLLRQVFAHLSNLLFNCNEPIRYYRISCILGRPVYSTNFYFNSLYPYYKVKSWCKNLKA